MNHMMQTGSYETFIPQRLYDTAVTFRPARPDDVKAIMEMHQRLSSNSLYLRYLVPYLPDYVLAHVREICAQPVRKGAALVAIRQGKVIGFGYYVIKPGQPNTAEPALLIEDQSQGKGIGGEMFQRLIAMSCAQGVTYFDALAHSTNRPMLHLLRRSGQPLKSNRDGSHTAVFLSLAATCTA
jgi:acetyltransferase